jgi:hypothetical protein
MKPRIAIGVGIGVGVLVLVFALTAPLMYEAWQQKRTVDQEFQHWSDAMVRRDYETAYSMTGSDFREAVPFDQFLEVQRRFSSQFGQLTKVKRLKTDVQGSGTPMEWVAVIKAELQGSEKTSEWLFEFHLEGGHWRLFGYKQL